VGQDSGTERRLVYRWLGGLPLSPAVTPGLRTVASSVCRCRRRKGVVT
jgi:hypothetical protein